MDSAELPGPGGVGLIVVAAHLIKRLGPIEDGKMIDVEMRLSVIHRILVHLSLQHNCNSVDPNLI